MRTITITVYRRPHYFKTLLQSLIVNDLEGWEVHIFVEPSPVQSEMIHLATEILGSRDWEAHVNSRRFGVKHNPFQALEYVFGHGSEVNLYLEEDLVLAPDATKMAAWYAENSSADEVCMNLIAGGCASAGMLSDPGYADVLVQMPTFNSLGFVATADQWRAHFKPHWFDFPFGMLSATGGRLADWDCAIYAHVMGRRELKVLQPVCARARHIGRSEGENCSEEFHDRAFSDLPILQESNEPLDYRRCFQWMELPHSIRSHLLLWKEVAGHQRTGRSIARRCLFPLWPWHRFKAAFRSWRKRQ